MDIKSLIDFYASKIRNHIKKILYNLEKEMLVTRLREASNITNLLIDYTILGKLIRGSLYLMISRIYGYPDTDNLLDIAAALEISHSGLLIHDDIIDNDKLRRGKPSIHSLYSASTFDWDILDRENYGKNMALCVGDICFFAANFFIGNSNLPSNIIKKISAYYNLQIIKTGLGQMSDIQYSFSSQDPDLAEILKIYHYKTANYTFNIPLVLGYLTNGLSSYKEILLLEKIGYSLGIIFQITDDLLGFLQDKEVTGKDAGSDIRENKKTIIRYFMLKKLKSDELKFAMKCFGNKNLSMADVHRLRKIFYLRKINNHIDVYIKREVALVQQNVARLSIDKKQQQNIVSLIEYIVGRIR